MEKKINVAELLKNCPKGMELDCLLYDNVTLDSVMIESSCHFNYESNYPIQIVTKSGFSTRLTKYGQNVFIEEAKCVIFPKGKTTWEGFQRPFNDGDVVFYSDTIAIFKEWGDETLFRTHVVKYLCCEDFIDINVPLFGKSIRKEIRFATEEEKQKLFDAIKANGYKWNAETKRLERLCEPRFKVGNRVKSIFNNTQYDIKALTDTHYTLVEVVNKFQYMEPIIDDKNWELVPDKFDITTLKPYDKVLVRDVDKHEWVISLFSHFNGLDICKHSCVNGIGWAQCIPYEGNEHLLGTSNDCDNYYKTWE